MGLGQRVAERGAEGAGQDVGRPEQDGPRRRPEPVRQGDRQDEPREQQRALLEPQVQAGVVGGEFSSAVPSVLETRIVSQ